MTSHCSACLKILASKFPREVSLYQDERAFISSTPSSFPFTALIFLVRKAIYPVFNIILKKYHPPMFLGPFAPKFLSLKRMLLLVICKESNLCGSSLQTDGFQNTVDPSIPPTSCIVSRLGASTSA